jgi:hypothetical protein
MKFGVSIPKFIIVKKIPYAFLIVIINLMNKINVENN